MHACTFRPLLSFSHVTPVAFVQTWKLQYLHFCTVFVAAMSCTQARIALIVPIFSPVIQDGNRSVRKIFGSLVKKAKDEKPDEFEYSREYVAIKPLHGPQGDLLLDVIAAVFHKAAELHCNGLNRPPPTLITTEERKQLLAVRKEAERLERERVEREAASDELKMVCR